MSFDLKGLAHRAFRFIKRLDPRSVQIITPDNAGSAHAPGWGLSLEGNPVDLGAMEQAFPAGTDPWIEWVKRGGDPLPVLRSGQLDAAPSAAKVRVLGEALLDRMNGAQFAENPALHLVTSRLNVIRFSPDGRLHHNMEALTASVRVATSFSAVLTKGDTGEVIPQNTAPPPPAARDWMAARSDPRIDNLLRYLGGGRDWGGIYRVLDAAGVFYGGERGLSAFLGPRMIGPLKRLKQTANHYRHGKGTDTLPDNPPTLEEALDLTAEIGRMVLADQAPIPALHR